MGSQLPSRYRECRDLERLKEIRNGLKAKTIFTPVSKRTTTSSSLACEGSGVQFASALICLVHSSATWYPESGTFRAGKPGSHPGGNPGANGWSLVKFHTTDTLKRWHLWEIDLRLTLNSTPGWRLRCAPLLTRFGSSANSAI